MAAAVDWLGVGDPQKAADAVDVTQRTHRPPDVASVEHRFSGVFDELYALADAEAPLTRSFLGCLNETHKELLPEIVAARRELDLQRARRAKAHHAA